VGRGLLITLEGIDGAGKSTQARALESLLRGRGLAVVATFEPGATPLGATLRPLLLASEVALAPDAEILLFLADRAEHVARVIEPALAEDTVVLCDRFVDSTLAYQGYGREADVARLARWNAECAGGLMPDLTLLLDCPVGEGARRRRRASDRYQRYGAGYQQRVRDGFLALAAREPGRIRVIDAGRPLEQVTGEVARVTLAWLEERGRLAEA
jgi:dTMP kinase